MAINEDHRVRMLGALYQAKKALDEVVGHLAEVSHHMDAIGLKSEDASVARSLFHGALKLRGSDRWLNATRELVGEQGP